MFPYPCPSCNQRLLASNERAGHKTICPKCLRPLTIPQPTGGVFEDPKTLVDPSEAPLPVFADTNTPFPGELPIPNFVAVGVSAATAVVGASAYANSGPVAAEDLFFELPPIAEQDQASHSGDSMPRPEHRDTPAPANYPNQLPLRKRQHRTNDARGMVMLNPTGLFSVDLSAELSAAISMRMKPPPELQLDRRLVIGAWTLGTVATLALWLGSLFYNPECLPFVALVGGAMLAFGILWRAYLVAQEESLVQGLLALIPPFNLIRLFEKSNENGHRPLRFALSGATAIVLFATGATARNYFEGQSVNAPREWVHPSQADRIHEVQGQTGALLNLLAELGTKRSFDECSTEDRAATAGELQKLLLHESPRVRQLAVAALEIWSPSDARKWIVQSLKGNNSDDLGTALARVPSNSPEAIHAVVEMLKTREYRLDAQKCLLAIGAPAEAALLDSFPPANVATAVGTIDVLVKIGGPKSLVALRRLAESAASHAIRAEADAGANQISTRLTK